MWIQTENTTKTLTVPEIDEFVGFSDNGTAQVSEETGERLIENYDSIEAYNNDES